MAQNDLMREVGRLAVGGGSRMTKTASRGLDSLLASLSGKDKAKAGNVGELRKEVEALQKEVSGASNKKQGDGAVKLAGLVFRTKGDFAAWVRVHAPGIPFGSVVDYHGLMQQVNSNMGGYESTKSILLGISLQ